MKIIARHNRWVVGASISESIDKNDPCHRRFVATVRGFRNWLIFDGQITSRTSINVQQRVREIRDRIDAGDETIFHEVDSEPPGVDLGKPPAPGAASPLVPGGSDSPGNCP